MPILQASDNNQAGSQEFSMKQVGKSVHKVDAHQKVTGQAKFAADLTMPDMLHLKLVYSEKPHARITRLDTDAALQVPGVKAILTAKDVPNNHCGLIKPDREVLCGSVVRFIGDPIAAVIADTPQQALEGVNRFIVDYDVLPVIDRPEAALEPEAVLIHSDSPNNIVFEQHYHHGDVSKALKESPVVVSGEYFTPMQEHAYLEPEAGISYIDDDGVVTIRCAGQNPHDDQHQIAQALGLPLDSVRVIYGPIGGAFGGREEVSIQIILALAAMTLKRPIKMVWNRSESIRGHCKRHAMTLKYTWGADQFGKITAAQMEIIADAGAYDYGSTSVLNNYLFAAVGPYEIPNIKLDSWAVYTNNVPGGAFRGYGFPQITFASELQIEQIAEKLGLDSISVRLLNCYKNGSRLQSRGLVPAGVSLERLITGCAEQIGYMPTGAGWQKPDHTPAEPHKKRGFGIAAGMKSCGFSLGYPEKSEAKVILTGGADIESATLITAATDFGQGAHTVLAQIAAETLGITLDKIRLIRSDTGHIGNAGPAAASRLTLYAGNAVKFAAEEALSKWRDEERPAVGLFNYQAPETAGQAGVFSQSQVNSISYGVQGVEVEVDIDTGEITICQIVAAHDPGKVVNPRLIEGQIEGGIVQALGWTLYENFITSHGQILTDTLSTYLIPTVLDIPDKITMLIDEEPDPMGPYGVRGIGEITFIPLAPAIISAIYDAVGIWFDRLPVTPEYFLKQFHQF